MRVVVPSQPDYTTPAVEYFQVQSGDMDINQVGVFSGIPADAKRCTLHWKQAGPDERSFTVTGSGLLSAFQIDNLDASGDVAWADVEKANTISKEFSPDLTYWDGPTFLATTHGSWDLKCAETVYLKFETHETGGVKEAANVYLEQDDKNGFYVQYEC